MYKGIPDRWRSAAWAALTDAKARSVQLRGRSQPEVGALLEKYRVSSSGLLFRPNPLIGLTIGHPDSVR